MFNVRCILRLAFKFQHSNISLLLHVSTKHARGEEEMEQRITVLEVVLKTRNCC